MNKRTRQSARQELESREWRGATRSYDIIKEGVIAIVIVSILVLMLSVFMGSPDEKPLTFKGWAQSNSANFYATVVQELAGTSESAGYGPPYNNASDGLNVGPLWLQKWAGVHHPINTVNDFVITPLTSQGQLPSVATAIKIWQASNSQQQSAWATALDTAITEADGDPLAVRDLRSNPAYGPVPQLAQGLSNMAKSGALDGLLLSQGGFFQTDNTKQILFFGDGGYLDDAATKANLQGNTWGMMNETGRYPGQAWLWLYSFWYQIKPFADESQHPFGANADAYILFIVGGLTLGLMLIPIVPGLRRIPHVIPVHRLIWKQYYKEYGTTREEQS